MLGGGGNLGWEWEIQGTPSYVWNHDIGNLSDFVLVHVSVEALPSHLDHPPGQQSSEHNIASQYSPYTEGVITLSQGSLY